MSRSSQLSNVLGAGNVVSQSTKSQQLGIAESETEAPLLQSPCIQLNAPQGSCTTSSISEHCRESSPVLTSLPLPTIQPTSSPEDMAANIPSTPVRPIPQQLAEPGTPLTPQTQGRLRVIATSYKVIFSSLIDRIHSRIFSAVPPASPSLTRSSAPAQSLQEPSLTITPPRMPSPSSLVYPDNSCPLPLSPNARSASSHTPSTSSHTHLAPTHPNTDNLSIPRPRTGSVSSAHSRHSSGGSVADIGVGTGIGGVLDTSGALLHVSLPQAAFDDINRLTPQPSPLSTTQRQQFLQSPVVDTPSKYSPSSATSPTRSPSASISVSGRIHPEYYENSHLDISSSPASPSSRTLHSVHSAALRRYRAVLAEAANLADSQIPVPVPSPTAAARTRAEVTRARAEIKEALAAYRSKLDELATIIQERKVARTMGNGHVTPTRDNTNISVPELMGDTDTNLRNTSSEDSNGFVVVTREDTHTNAANVCTLAPANSSTTTTPLSSFLAPSPHSFPAPADLAYTSPVTTAATNTTSPTTTTAIPPSAVVVPSAVSADDPSSSFSGTVYPPVPDSNALSPSTDTTSTDTTSTLTSTFTSPSRRTRTPVTRLTGADALAALSSRLSAAGMSCHSTDTRDNSATGMSISGACARDMETSHGDAGVAVGAAVVSGSTNTKTNTNLPDDGAIPRYTISPDTDATTTAASTSSTSATSTPTTTRMSRVSRANASERLTGADALAALSARFQRGPSTAAITPFTSSVSSSMPSSVDAAPNNDTTATAIATTTPTAAPTDDTTSASATMASPSRFTSRLTTTSTARLTGADALAALSARFKGTHTHTHAASPVSASTSTAPSTPSSKSSSRNVYDGLSTCDDDSDTEMISAGKDTLLHTHIPTTPSSLCAASPSSSSSLLLSSPSSSLRDRRAASQRQAALLIARNHAAAAAREADGAPAKDNDTEGNGNSAIASDSVGGDGHINNTDEHAVSVLVLATSKPGLEMSLTSSMSTPLPSESTLLVGDTATLCSDEVVATPPSSNTATAAAAALAFISSKYQRNATPASGTPAPVPFIPAASEDAHGGDEGGSGATASVGSPVPYRARLLPRYQRTPTTSATTPTATTTTTSPMPEVNSPPDCAPMSPPPRTRTRYTHSSPYPYPVNRRVPVDTVYRASVDAMNHSVAVDGDAVTDTVADTVAHSIDGSIYSEGNGSVISVGSNHSMISNGSSRGSVVSHGSVNSVSSVVITGSTATVSVDDPYGSSAGYNSANAAYNDATGSDGEDSVVYGSVVALETDPLSAAVRLFNSHYGNIDAHSTHSTLSYCSCSVGGGGGVATGHAGDGISVVVGGVGVLSDALLEMSYVPVAMAVDVHANTQTFLPSIGPFVIPPLFAPTRTHHALNTRVPAPARPRARSMSLLSRACEAVTDALQSGQPVPEYVTKTFEKRVIRANTLPGPCAASAVALRQRLNTASQCPNATTPGSEPTQRPDAAYCSGYVVLSWDGQPRPPSVPQVLSHLTVDHTYAYAHATQNAFSQLLKRPTRSCLHSEATCPARASGAVRSGRALGKTLPNGDMVVDAVYRGAGYRDALSSCDSDAGDIDMNGDGDVDMYMNEGLRDSVDVSAGARLGMPFNTSVDSDHDAAHTRSIHLHTHATRQGMRPDSYTRTVGNLSSVAMGDLNITTPAGHSVMPPRHLPRRASIDFAAVSPTGMSTALSGDLLSLSASAGAGGAEFDENTSNGTGIGGGTAPSHADTGVRMGKETGMRTDHGRRRVRFGTSVRVCVAQTQLDFPRDGSVDSEEEEEWAYDDNDSGADEDAEKEGHDGSDSDDFESGSGRMAGKAATTEELLTTVCACGGLNGACMCDAQSDCSYGSVIIRQS